MSKNSWHVFYTAHYQVPNFCLIYYANTDVSTPSTTNNQHVLMLCSLESLHYHLIWLSESMFQLTNPVWRESYKATRAGSRVRVGYSLSVIIVCYPQVYLHIYFVCVCVCVTSKHVYHMHAGAFGGQKRMLRVLKLELGNPVCWTLVFCKSSKCSSPLSHFSISLSSILKCVDGQTTLC